MGPQKEDIYTQQSFDLLPSCLKERGFASMAIIFYKAWFLDWQAAMAKSINYKINAGF